MKRSKEKTTLSCSKKEWVRRDGDPFNSCSNKAFLFFRVRAPEGGFLRFATECDQCHSHVPGGVSLSNMFPETKKRGSA